jgi:hypothetical protein
MDRRVFIAGGLAGLALMAGALFFMDSDEDEIRELLAKLAEAASLPENRGNPAFFALGMKSKLGEILAPGARLTAPELESGAGLDEIVGAAMQYGEAYRRVDVTFLEVRFVRLEKSSASVETKIALTAIDGQGAPRRQTRAVKVEVTKASGDWKVAAIDAGPPG